MFQCVLGDIIAGLIRSVLKLNFLLISLKTVDREFVTCSMSHYTRNSKKINLIIRRDKTFHIFEARGIYT